MKFFSKSFGRPISDYKSLKKSAKEAILACENYRLHLQKIAEKLPVETRNFVLSPQYSDPKSHDCPHDAWLQDLIFKVVPDAGKRQSLQATMVLLGSFHDRILTFEYNNVVEFSLDMSKASQKSPGDWLHDEFDIDDNRFVTHEILWQFGNPWKITAEKIIFSVHNKT